MSSCLLNMVVRSFREIGVEKSEKIFLCLISQNLFSHWAKLTKTSSFSSGQMAAKPGHGFRQTPVTHCSDQVRGSRALKELLERQRDSEAMYLQEDRVFWRISYLMRWRI